MNGKPSIAEEIFRRILDHEGHPDAVAHLRAMVNATPPTMESEYLDFKGWSNPQGSLTENEEKKIWSEALAGFATTSGGVLIWGIDARKNPQTKVDEACGFALVADPGRKRCNDESQGVSGVMTPVFFAC